jgi:acetoin utilization protein AcuC
MVLPASSLSDAVQGSSRRAGYRQEVPGHGPTLVFGPRSTTYDFGPEHPLTPRRFGPGIELLGSLGAEPGLAPEPASDEELGWIHDPVYIEVVRAFSREPLAEASHGIGAGDTPPFPGMHDASAAVAGGSLRAMDSILRGDIEHAFHPGGGLHHAMPDRASGFCVYNDPALAIARARREGLRVLYVDLDVHHGDGVQAIHWDDPGVVTLSIHETGEALFPGTGFIEELGGPHALGSKVNVPLEPGTGERGWLAALARVLPVLAEEHRPEVVVSQHGSDGHAWDPLAHLRLTTTVMGAAARLVDAVAHRWAGGRWLATGGGGYDAYRVVPRAWSLVWLAGAHLDPPPETPLEWRRGWSAAAASHGQAPMPERFEDEPNVGRPFGPADDVLDRRALESAEAALAARRTAIAAGRVVRP